MNWFGMFQLNKRSKQPYGNNNIIALQTNNDKQQTRNTHTHTNSKQKCRAYTNDQTATAASTHVHNIASCFTFASYTIQNSLQERRRRVHRYVRVWLVCNRHSCVRVYDDSNGDDGVDDDNDDELPEHCTVAAQPY